MYPYDFTQQSEDYQRIEKAIGFIGDNFKCQPTLDQIAESVHLSKYHFTRVFKRWAGISPIQFLHYLTLDYTKRKLADAGSLLETALDAGLSGPSRLHDLFVTLEAMTPGEFKRMGKGLEIRYGFSASPFGESLLAITDRGICHLGFVNGDDRTAAFDQLRYAWPGAVFVECQTEIRSLTHRIFSLSQRNEACPFHLQLKGTNFQVNVWRALLTIPAGSLVTYGDIAAHVGYPRAFRAVANAIAVNPIGYLIPCHRVLTKSGVIHQYRWGSVRKKAMVGWEAASMGV